MYISLQPVVYCNRSSKLELGASPVLIEVLQWLLLPVLVPSAGKRNTKTFLSLLIIRLGVIWVPEINFTEN